jgi:hypothetical protein
VSSHDLFELELLGGAVERQYRARRPHAERMPWGSLDLAAYTEEELAAGRRGWTDLAIQEYAAAASQANVLRMIVRARAPLDLSAMLASFPLDELAHTELCARMAAELGGAAAIAYPVAEVFPEPAHGRGSLLVQAARAVAWEFCVGETLSHGQLAFHRRHATRPLLAAVWGRLVKDEAAHARFGWLFLDWATPLLTAEERAEVATTIESAIAHVDHLDAKVNGLEPEAFLDVGVFGSQGREAYLAETRAVLEEQVVRRLRALTGGRGRS